MLTAGAESAKSWTKGNMVPIDALELIHNGWNLGLKET